MSIANGDLEKLDLIMNFCNEKILLTNRINSKTKYLNIDSICVPITKKMIQNNLFIPSNDEEKNIIDSFKKTFNNNNLIIDIKYYNGNDSMDFYIGKFSSNSRRMVGEIKNISQKINKNIVFDFSFIDIKRIDEKLDFSLYKLSFENEEIKISFIDSLQISMNKEKGMILPCSLEEFIDFLNQDTYGLVCSQYEIIQNFIYDFYSYQKGFIDIYDDVKKAIRFDIKNITQCFTILYYYFILLLSN